MKQIFGYFLVICSIPLLFLIGIEVKEEIVTAKTYEEKIEAAISLPQVQAQLPVTLLDRDRNIFSEEYVEWREPLYIRRVSANR